MILGQALELDGSTEIPIVAFVGAGGKTNAMFQLASQLIETGHPSVIISTTTHLSADEVDWADAVIRIPSGSMIPSARLGTLNGVVVVCGDSTEDGRVQGLSEENLERLYAASQDNRIPLLIEADGSRRKPIKSPNQYEPVIPSFTNIVIVVVGLSSIGMILDKATVHREDLFSRVTGRSVGEKILPIDVVSMLNHPEGGLKNIPDCAKRIVLLNQVDTLDSHDIAHDIAFQTRSHYHHILIASIKTKSLISAVHGKVAGIILAAGSSTRMDRPKQLLEWKGRTLIEHVIRIAEQSGLNPIHLVLGANEEQILASLERSKVFEQFPVNVISNPDWKDGQSTSVRSGTQQLNHEIDGCVFLLADQPLIPPDLVKRLQIKRAESRSWAVIPRYLGKRANPVLFGKELFDRLRNISGDQGGRAILDEAQALSVSWVECDDPGTIFDVDIESDYQRLIEGTWQ